MQDISQKYEQEYRARLIARMIEFEPSTDWYDMALACLLCRSAFQLAMTGQELADLYHALVLRERLSYYLFAAANNAIENTSYKEVRNDFDLRTYMQGQQTAAAYAIEWNKNTAAMRDELIQELVQEQSQQKGQINGAMVRSMNGGQA